MTPRTRSSQILPVTAIHTALQVTRRILGAPTVGPLLALLLAMAFFSVRSENFLQGQNSRSSSSR